ncbi:MAG: NUDIX hydrolase [Verrucomicrobiota bacterium]|nr:NUDIX hydrolase [Verrucomicrobiota bacterium]
MNIQDKYYHEFLRKGCSPSVANEYSRVGVVAEDRYWIWFRDPLILPNGKTTAYNRFFPKSGLNGVAGVSVMGISKEGKVLVNLIFRHATREWEIELPRGGRGKNETAEEAAFRELAEETGIRGETALKIASIASDSGILSNVLDIFVVKDFHFSNETNREFDPLARANLAL